MLTTISLSDPGRGHISLFMGPMFSGKTNEMLCKLNKFDHIKNALVMLIKYKGDDRDGDEMVQSRDGIGRISSARVEKGSEIQELIIEEANDHPTKTSIVVGIDEAQFISDMAGFARWVLGERDELPNVTIIIYISALDSTYERKMWPEIIQLVPYCNEVIKLNAICGTCQSRSAQLTRRDIEGDQLVIIGSQEKYTATCNGCYNKK